MLRLVASDVNYAPEGINHSHNNLDINLLVITQKKEWNIFNMEFCF